MRIGRIDLKRLGKTARIKESDCRRSRKLALVERRLNPAIGFVIGDRDEPARSGKHASAYQRDARAAADVFVTARRRTELEQIVSGRVLQTNVSRGQYVKHNRNCPSTPTGGHGFDRDRSIDRRLSRRPGKQAAAGKRHPRRQRPRDNRECNCAGSTCLHDLSRRIGYI